MIQKSPTNTDEARSLCCRLACLAFGTATIDSFYGDAKLFEAWVHDLADAANSAQCGATVKLCEQLELGGVMEKATINFRALCGLNRRPRNKKSPLRVFQPEHTAAGLL